MKRRSYIFSFDTLSLKTWPSHLLKSAAVVLLILLIDLGFRASGLSERFLVNHPRSETGILIYLEKLIPDNPEIVFFGDSISRNAILPRIAEEELGLPAGSAVNLSITSGTPFDAYKMYRRNEERTRRARYIVYSVNAFQFNANWHEKNITNRWRYLSDMSDLRYVYGLQQQISFAASSVLSGLRLYRDSYIFSYYVENPGKLLREEPETLRSDERTGFIYFREFGDRSFPQTEEFLADRHMEDFRLSNRMLDYLNALAGICRENGQQLILVEFPKKKRYVEYMESRYREALSEISSEIERTGIPLVPMSRFFGSIEYTDDDFIDYGHLNFAGAEKTTRFLTDILRNTVMNTEQKNIP